MYLPCCCRCLQQIPRGSKNARATVTALRDIFSRHGLPEIIVSDNGPQFTATEFQRFCSNNGILHRTSAAYKPSTNGQAERVVQILKSAIKQAHVTNADVADVIARYLLIYRNTPHSTTGEPPSMLLMGRRLRTHLDLLTPSVEKHVEARQYSTMLSRTAHRGLRQFNAGDTVLARNYGRGEKLVRGVITEVLGSRHYIVKVAGNLWKRHVDQLLRRPQDTSPVCRPPVFEQWSVPLDVPANMDQPCEMVPDSTIPFVPVSPAVTLDESPLVVTQEDSHLANKVSTLSKPTSSLPEISDPVTADDSLLVHQGSSCEKLVNTEKRYPTRTTHRLPSYLKDYEIK